MSEREKAMIEATFSHVDGRDLLSELQPNHWHFCNIRVRINGQWKEYEGDWLKRLFKARELTPRKGAIAKLKALFTRKPTPA